MSFVAAMLALTLAVLAADPSTKPVTVDLSSPKAALKTFVDGIKSGDVEAAKKVCRISDEQDKKLVNAGVAWESALERLVAVVQEKLGEDAATAVRDKVGNAAPSTFVPALEKALASVEFDNGSDSQTVALDEGNPPLKLAKDGTDWKIDVAQTMTDVQPQQKQRLTRMMNGSAKKIHQAREAVASGKITSVDQLTQAMATKEK
jgi:hypothetical protein